MVRLRSVLLTSGTTIVGLLPLLLTIEWDPISVHWIESENQDIWQNLALTSIGGLVSSTVLILLALPPLYYFSVQVGWALRQIGLWIAAAWCWLGSGLHSKVFAAKTLE
jgi:Cu/Ag efflux pump CusA